MAAFTVNRVPLEREESSCNTNLLVPLAPGGRSPRNHVTRVPVLSAVPPSLAETRVVAAERVYESVVPKAVMTLVV